MKSIPFTGPFDTARLSDELIAVGIIPITIRSSGQSVEVLVADGVDTVAVQTVAAQHDPVDRKAARIKELKAKGSFTKQEQDEAIRLVLERLG